MPPGLWNYFIDAKNGDVLQAFNGLDTLSQASGPGGNGKIARTWTNEPVAYAPWAPESSTGDTRQYSRPPGDRLRTGAQSGLNV